MGLSVLFVKPEGWARFLGLFTFSFWVIRKFYIQVLAIQPLF